MRAPQRAARPSRSAPIANAVAETAVQTGAIADLALSAPSQQQAFKPSADPLRVAGERSVVAGSVVDASGGPIPGALLVVRSFASPEPLATGFSDAEGHFRVAAPLGYSEVSAQSEAYSRAALAVQAPAENLRLVLAAGATIEGRVIDRATGAPIGALKVQAENRNGIRAPLASVVSEADGSFRIVNLAAGGYDVQAIGPQFRSDVKWVTVDVGQTSESVDLRVAPASTLTAFIQASGEPCAAGAIQLSGPIEATATTNSDGLAQIEGLLRGQYTLLARCDGAIPLQEQVELNGAAVQRHFELSRGLELRGSVVDRSGRGLAGLAVLVQPAPAGAAAQVPIAAPRQCVTDAAGAFACSGFMPGSYDCEANAQGQKLSDVQRVVLTADEPTVLTLTARDTASIRVTFPLGARGLGRHTVFARNEQDLPLQPVQDGDELVFDHLELGSYRVYAGIGVEEPPNARRIELTESGQVAKVSLELPASLAISGRVVDAARQPVPDAWVHATTADPVRADSWSDAVLTDGSGFFTIDDLSPGRYELRATQAAGEGTAQVVSAGSTDVVISLQRYGSLAGLVTAATGDEVTGFTLQYGVPGGGSHEIVMATGSRWGLPWIAPGEYLLVASSKLGTATTQVKLEPGARLDVPLVLNPAIEGAGSPAPSDAP